MEDYQGKRVLIVEDQEMFREALSFELQSLGFAVEAASEGEEGFALAAAGDFDLIVSDMCMPNWDGQRLLREIRSANLTTPFAFLTGYSDMSLRDAYALGADAFLGKPTSPDKFLATIKTLLAPEAARWAVRPDGSPVIQLRRHLPSLVGATGGELCEIGRSGLCLTLPAAGLVVRPGDLVGLDLRFDAGPLDELRGIGRLIWRTPGDSAGHVCLGVAFEYLDEPTRSAVAAYLQATKPLATIPRCQG